MLILKPLGNCTLDWIRFLPVASCLLIGSSSSWTGCVVWNCDDRRTRSVGKWQLKWLEKQPFGVGWDSNCTSLWNGSFHDMSFLYTKPLIILLLQQGYPTDCKFVIECLYWDAAPERTVKQNIHLLYLFYDVFLVELCHLCRDGLTVYSNSPSFEVPDVTFGRSCNLRDG
jgi:hypothetical protein